MSMYVASFLTHRRVGGLLCEAIEDLKQKEKMGQLDLEEPTFLTSLLAHGTFGMAEIEMIVLDLFIAGTDSVSRSTDTATDQMVFSSFDNAW